MTEMLTAEGYAQTQETLRQLESQLAEIDSHTDLDLDHLASARRTCKSMMRRCVHDIKQYEAEIAEQELAVSPS